MHEPVAADYLAMMGRKIDTHGWMLQAVVPAVDDPDGNPWVYTVGMAHHHRPDLALFGLDPSQAGTILNRLCAQMAEADITAGSTLSGQLASGLDLKAVAVPPAHWWQWFGAGLSYYLSHDLSPYAVLQIVWPDEAGRFPWEAGFNSAFAAAQPVLR